ncbi:MAG: hypothetical protein KAK00_03205 [Nanoarchaeota archaeon]|nr:hypothetical protein [Nanoarchaeota archaeon]
MDILANRYLVIAIIAVLIWILSIGKKHVNNEENAEEIGSEEYAVLDEEGKIGPVLKTEGGYNYYNIKTGKRLKWVKVKESNKDSKMEVEE